MLGCDAGSILSLEADGTLANRAAKGLSPMWLARSTPLSATGALDEGEGYVIFQRGKRCLQVVT
mgnify:CR=1 FL=1